MTDSKEVNLSGINLPTYSLSEKCQVSFKPFSYVDGTPKLMSGKEFNERYPEVRLVKLTNPEEIHNTYQFRTGVNKESKIMTFEENCDPNGLYFTTLENIGRWFSYNGSGNMHYIRDVTLPDGALVWIGGSKFKASEIILGERKMIEDLPELSDEAFCMHLAHQSAQILNYVDQTDSFCSQVLDYYAHSEHAYSFITNTKFKNKHLDDTNKQLVQTIITLRKAEECLRYDRKVLAWLSGILGSLTVVGALLLFKKK